MAGQKTQSIDFEETSPTVCPHWIQLMVALRAGLALDKAQSEIYLTMCVFFLKTWNSWRVKCCQQIIGVVRKSLSFLLPGFPKDKSCQMFLPSLTGTHATGRMVNFIKDSNSVCLLVLHSK